MKILILSNKIPYPPKDGGSIATLNLLKSLSNLGNKIVLLTMNTEKHYFELEKLPLFFTKNIKTISVYVKASINKKDALKNLFFSKLPYSAERFFNKNYKIGLIKILKKEKFDIIQLEGLPLALYISIIRKYSASKISMRSHNIEDEIWERSSKMEKNIFKKFYLKILSKRIRNLEFKSLKKYDFLLPITKRDEKVFSKFEHKCKILVTPTGINSKELKPDFTKIKYPSIFHLGALDWLPNQEGLIWFFDKVWKNLIKKNPNLKFYLAGRNAPDFIREKFKNIKNLIFLGEIKVAKDFINSHAIMIVPLFSGSGMRIKIIEGMALGKTIITTSIGTEGINSTHKKNILIANSPKSFEKEIQKVLDDKLLFQEIGKNAIVFVKKNFDNENIAKKLMQFYKENL